MRIVNFVLVAAALAAPALANATPITGGTTVVRVLVPLGSIVPGVTGNASVRSTSPLDLLFPITGGDATAGGTNGATGTILHAGSGFTLTIGSTVAEVDNLVIDATAGTVLGDVLVNGVSAGTGLTVFTLLGGVSYAQLTDLANPLLQVNLSQTSVDLLATLGVTTDTNQRFGTVATAPIFATVPEPAAFALFGLGLIGLAAARRRAA